MFIVDRVRYKLWIFKEKRKIFILWLRLSGLLASGLSYNWGIRKLFLKERIECSLTKLGIMK